MNHKLAYASVLLVTLLLAACGGTPKTPATPAAPTGLTVTPGDGVITLRWQDNSDDETGFSVFRQITSPPGSSVQQDDGFDKLATVAANTTEYTDSEVLSGTLYRYGIAAEGKSGPSSRTTAETGVAAPVGNRAPSADAQERSTQEDTPVTVTLTGSDPEGDTLTFAVARQPGKGGLGAVDQATGAVLYTPNPNANGQDSFTFTVSDGKLTSAPAVVTLNLGVVNDAPVADAQTVVTNEDAAANLTLTASDSDGDELSYEVVAQPRHGKLTGTAPGLTYTPSPNYNGPDGFTFKANDGFDDSSVVTVGITVQAVDDAPVVTMTSPSDGADLQRGVHTLAASATDVEDGDVSAAVTWTSSLDGNLGDGKNVTLSSGRHTLTASVTVTGTTGSASVTVTVSSTVDGDVTVSNQAELDALRRVVTITGDLTVTTQATRLDFAPLDALREVEGEFALSGTALTSVSGFGSLSSVGGAFLIGTNPALASVPTFAKLSRVGELYIYANAELTSTPGFAKLSSVGELYIGDNAALTSISGFDNLASVSDYLGLQDNDALTSISGFDNLSSVGVLSVYSNTSLTSISGFAKLTSNTVNFSEVSDQPQFDCRANPPTFAPVNYSWDNKVNCTVKP